MDGDGLFCSFESEEWQSIRHAPRVNDKADSDNENGKYEVVMCSVYKSTELQKLEALCCSDKRGGNKLKPWALTH